MSELCPCSDHPLPAGPPHRSTLVDDGPTRSSVTRRLLLAGGLAVGVTPFVPRLVGPAGAEDLYDSPDLATKAVRPIMYPIVPVQGTSVNRLRNYGDDRGSHIHAGEDMMAAKLSLLLACVDGTVVRRVFSASGNYLYLKGDDGWIYGYLHINNDTPGTDDAANPSAWAFGPGIVEGATVRRGQLVAYVGDSGNAESVGSHLHFEIRKPNTRWYWAQAVNPAPSLDAADPTSATELFEDLAKSGVLIRGIFHSAMVLDDCLIESLDADRLERVLRAKIAIAANLDRLSRDLRHLDHFVLFSSATTLVGNPGQANYVAGNAYLEELARRRRQDGLPALAVAWGPIGDVGYLTGNDTLAQIAARKLARHSLSVTSALDALEQTIACDDGRVETASVGLGRFDFDALQRELPLAATNLFAAVRKVTREEKAEAIESSDLAKELTTLTAAEARTRVELVLKTEVAHILKMTPSQIDSMKPLAELGVDSLMGVELRIAAEERLGVDIPLMSIGGAGSIADLAEKCLGQLRKAE